MKVQDLQQFLRALMQPMVIADAKKAAKDLEATAAALEPFRELSVEELGEWLGRTDHYRRTNEHMFAGKKRGAAKPKVSKEEALKQSTQRLLELYEKALDADYSHEAVKQEIQNLKSFSKAELEQIARELNIAKLPSRAKKEAYLDELERKITERRENYENKQVLTGAEHSAPHSRPEGEPSAAHWRDHGHGHERSHEPAGGHQHRHETPVGHEG